MQFIEIIRSALNALKINKLRTLLTMLGVIIGITSVILIYSIGQGAVAFITNELSSFGTDYFQINPGSNQMSAIAGSNALSMEDYETLKGDTSITNIKEVSPFSMGSVNIDGNDVEDDALAYGVAQNAIDILRPDITYGEFITDEQDLNSEHVVVLGEEVAKKFFGEETSPVEESLNINNRTYRVVGVVSSSSVLAGGFLNNAIFLPISVLQDQITGEEALQEIDISVHDPEIINQTIEDVKTLLREEHQLKEDDEDDFRIQSAKDMLETTKTITSLLTAMVAAISGISLVVGGVGVMNIMLVSVTERTREIGLLKAIGAKERDILTQFLFESIVMTFIGGLTGIVLGISGAFLVSVVLHIPFIVSIPAVLLAVGVSAAVGILFGIYPARRAARLSPIDALQYQ